MLDLTTHDEFDIQHVLKDPFQGISKEYLDHGDQNIICQICNAKLWAYEGRRSQKMEGKTCYLLCCAYGKVELPELKNAQQDYQHLFQCVDSKSKYFLKNIRRYNAMFSFTSMGGKIDSSINRGNAPFIFRLSGQNYHTMCHTLNFHNGVLPLGV